MRGRMAGVFGVCGLVLLCLTLEGCGSGPSCNVAAQPVGRTAYLAGFTPYMTPAGSPALTITATGSYFECSTVLLWDGQPLTTTALSPTELTAHVPAADLTTPGYYPIAVVNPGQPYSGGGLDFEVTATK